MGIRRVIVCEVQVPFVHGGAEYHVRRCISSCAPAGIQAELVSIPFKWYPKREILAHAAAWRLIDLSESNGEPIDLVIGTKFPSYFVRHPNKVAWLIHQYRAAYELCGTEYSDFSHTRRRCRPEADADRSRHENAGRVPAPVCQCAEHREPAGEVQRTDGRSAVSSAAVRRPPRPGPLWRLRAVRRPPRVDQAPRSRRARDAARRSSDTLVMVGDGTQRARTEALAESLGVADRIDFAGSVDEQGLIDLYKGALAVIYSPFDEDYGYVTLESFLARKPVITTTDAGGPLEFVEHETNGFIASRPRRRWRPPSIDSRPTRAWPRVSAMPATSARAWSRGTA